MTMKLSDLKRIISEEVKNSLNEAPASKVTVPKKFREFRQMIGNALKKAKAPVALVDEILDLDYEGDATAGILFNAWENFFSDVGTDEADNVEYWNDFSNHSVHDCVIDLLDAVGAGPKYDRTKITAIVTKALIVTAAPSPDQVNKSNLRDFANFVLEMVFEDCQSVSSINWNGKDSTITYTISVTEDEFYQELGDCAEKAGLMPDAVENTWIDSVSGMKIHFGAGAATISSNN